MSLENDVQLLVDQLIPDSKKTAADDAEKILLTKDSLYKLLLEVVLLAQKYP
jgi:hypothetical protein